MIAFMLAEEATKATTPVLDGIHQILIALIALMTAMGPILKSYFEGRGEARKAEQVAVLQTKLVETTTCLASTVEAIEKHDVSGAVKSGVAAISAAKGVDKALDAQVQAITGTTPKPEAKP